ncbi:MAG: hypothetical protein D4S01_10365 [Dehalococcoidia bacterium]|nr:MAG: hypothetical protein D4S01_10365 [Dehalococcoidia bacterium]
MSDKPLDNFENEIFWELYKDLERQFENFLEYVPYLEGNENVYSFKLLNLLLSIGGYVDSAFKEMARYPNFSKNKDCQEILEKVNKNKTVSVTLPLRAFEKEYHLSEKTVIFRRLPERERIMPFKPRSTRAKSPKWWKIYNGIKHDVGVNLKEATLQNTMHALAGAFMLNAVHYPSLYRLYEYLVLKEAEGVPMIGFELRPRPLEWIKQEYESGRKISFKLKTPRFIYDYEQ